MYLGVCVQLASSLITRFGNLNSLPLPSLHKPDSCVRSKNRSSYRATSCIIQKVGVELIVLRIANKQYIEANRAVVQDSWECCIQGVSGGGNAQSLAKSCMWGKCMDIQKVASFYIGLSVCHT